MARVCPHCGVELPEAPVDVCSDCFNPIDEGSAVPVPDPNAVVGIAQERRQPEPHRIHLAIMCLRISVILYLVLVALLCLLLPALDEWGKRFAIYLIFFGLAIAVGLEPRTTERLILKKLGGKSISR